METMTGNERYAFFDVDGTLISIKSMFMFRRFCLGRLRRYRGWTGYVRYYVHALEHSVLSSIGASRELLNKRYYRKYRGAERREVLVSEDHNRRLVPVREVRYWI